jgi:hypothetical protein
LKNKGIKPTNQNVVDYALKTTINAHSILDEDSLEMIQ